MKTYARYKDSGISWIGEIPEHWDVNYLFQKVGSHYISNKDIHHQNLLSLSYGRIIQKDINKTEGLLPTSFDTYQVVENGNIVLRLTDLQNDHKSLRVGFVTQEGIVTSAYECLCVINDATFPKYLYYQLHSFDIKKMFYGMGGGLRQNLSYGELKKIRIAAPPISEQKAIVDFLDEKTAKINELVAAKQKQIELLKEYKQSFIANAVTKGVNPKVKMKDSGINWIGQIPEHWELSRIRHYFAESDEKTFDESATLLSLSQYTGISLKSESPKVGMSEAETTEGYKVVHKGQFVMNIMLAWNGSYAVSDLDGVISPAYCVFDFVKDCDKWYFHYLLRIKAYSGAFKTLSKGIIDSRLRLYPNKFYTFPLIVPPIDEQKQIVALINERVASIDSQISSIEKQIENLNEYKQSLISDVVTGKVKV